MLAGRRKVLSLLAFLACRAPHAVARAELVALFWGDRDDAHGRQSLRQALAELRSVLGDGLAADAEHVRLGAEVVALDVAAFEALVQQQRWDDAARAWTGDFLIGTESLAGEAWQGWLRTTRAALHAQAAQAFEMQAVGAEHAGEWRTVIEWATRWCEVAPHDERALATRLRALVAAGRPIDASVLFESFTRRLRAEGLGEPSPEFLALRPSFAASRGTGARPPRPTGPVTLSTLTQLPPDARTLAEVVAVIGGATDEETLRGITDLPAFNVRAALDALVARGILRRTDATPPAWEFISDADRQRVYDVIARDRRRGLHRAVWDRFGAGASEAERQRFEEHRVRGEAPRSIQISGRVVAGIAAVLLAVVAIPYSVSRIARADAMELEPGSRILLADVRNETGEPHVGPALGTAAALGLQQSEHVALVPQSRARALATPSGPRGERRLDVETARGIAVRESVARVVSLGVVRAESTYRLAARVIDPRTGQVVGEEQVEVGRHNLVDGLDGLIARVRVRLGESPSALRESSRPLRAVASPSLEALEAYTEGTRASAAGDAATARRAWMRALALDSSFALAELALAHDAFARGDSLAGDAWMERAVAHGDRLTTLEALRARQVRALRAGDARQAATLATTIAEREPSGDAWFTVGEAALAAGGCAEAEPPLGNALALDSLHVPTRLALARCALERGDVRGAMRHHTVVQATDSTIWMRGGYRQAWGNLLVRSGRPADAEAVFGDLVAIGSAADSLTGLRSLGALEMYRGRYAVALPLLQHATRLARRDGAGGELRRSLLTELDAFLAIGGRTRASEVADELVALMTTDADVTPSELFHLGHRLARLGRVNGAREVLRRLSAGAVPDLVADQWAARLLNATLHVVERAGPEALAALGGGSTASVPAAPPTLEAFRLALTADAHLLAGQLDEAAVAAARLAETWYFGGLSQDEWLRAPLRQARIAETRGDTTAAIAAYRRFVDRWKEADLYLVDLAAAQRALARLGGAPMTVSR